MLPHRRWRLPGLALLAAIAALLAVLTIPATAQSPDNDEAVAPRDITLHNHPSHEYVPITGTELTVPGPGTFAVQQQVRGEFQSQPGVLTHAGITSRLVYTDTGQEVPSSKLYVFGRLNTSPSNTATGYGTTATGQVFLDISKPTQIRIEAMRWLFDGSTPFAAIRSDDVGGLTKLSYMKIHN